MEFLTFFFLGLLLPFAFCYDVPQLQKVDRHTENRRFIQILGVLLYRQSLGDTCKRIVFPLAPRVCQHACLVFCSIDKRCTVNITTKKNKTCNKISKVEPPTPKPLAFGQYLLLPFHGVLYGKVFPYACTRLLATPLTTPAHHVNRM